MSFDEEYIDPHGECAAEIKRLRGALADIAAKADEAMGVVEARLTGSLKNIIVHKLDGVRANARAALQ